MPGWRNSVTTRFGSFFERLGNASSALATTWGGMTGDPEHLGNILSEVGGGRPLSPTAAA
jgi:hypothetical protein